MHGFNNKLLSFKRRGLEIWKMLCFQLRSYMNQHIILCHTRLNRMWFILILTAYDYLLFQSWVPLHRAVVMSLFCTLGVAGSNLDATGSYWHGHGWSDSDPCVRFPSCWWCDSDSCAFPIMWMVWFWLMCVSHHVDGLILRACVHAYIKSSSTHSKISV